MTEIAADRRAELIAAAETAAQKAHVPYSNFPVGAALLTRDGQIISGCNVENASYPAGICAERTAIVKAVSEGHTDFLAIAVTGQTDEPITPCGICRQTIREFAPDLLIICSNKKGSTRDFTLPDLLPFSFGPEAL